MYVQAKPDQTIVLGRLGENERVYVVFDVSDILDELGADVSFTLLYRKPGDDVAYPVSAVGTDREEGTVTWLVSAADTSVTGRGQCQLLCTLGEVIAKTLIWTTIVLTALDGSGEVPEEWESWQEVFAGLKADAEEAAADAEEAADRAEQVAAVSGFMDVSIENGRLIYIRTDTADVDLSIDSAGHLIMEVV